MQTYYPNYELNWETKRFERKEPHDITFAYFKDIMLSKAGD